MKTKIFINSLAALLLVAGAYMVFAQGEPEIDIAFPVAELGNCGSKEECKSYCDDVENIAACVDFAERHGIMSGEELQEAKKVAQAISQGAQLPGGCRNKEECDTYCQEGSHIEECIAFAEAAGFMSAEELAEAKRIAPFMARGEMPGGCRSKEQCEAYCSNGSNTEECVVFFQKAGFMSAEDAEMFRKTGGKGPGDCRGKEKCEAFCNDPANQALCFEFAQKHDLIPEEELRNIEEGMSKFREGFHNAPPEVAQCLKDTIGEEVLAKIESGTFMPNPSLGEHMRTCFEQFMPRPEGIPQEGFSPEDGQRMMPPEASDCIQGILGDMSQMQGPPTAEQEQRIREECFPQSQGGPASPQGGLEGGSPQEFQGQFQQEFNQQSQEQYQRQYQEEFQRQMQQQMPEGFQPQGGFEMPQEFHGEQTVPMEQAAPVEQSAPTEAPAVESSMSNRGFLGSVVEAMRPGLRILFPFLPI